MSELFASLPYIGDLYYRHIYLFYEELIGVKTRTSFNFHIRYFFFARHVDENAHSSISFFQLA